MPTDSTTPLVTISTFAMLIGIILMVGSVWGALLLLKDAKKHKKFAKIIRIIAAVVQLTAILGSILIVSVVFSNIQSVGARFAGLMTVLLVISFLSMITNVRGAMLLFIQAGKMKKFAKWIRIICGVLMIVSLFSSVMTGL
ncbi:MAG: hypothetical protein NTX91_03930 [candidate division SR1 bacterium]|nr:hypothetical protein [candidate division SR1 bacterium]